MKNLLRGPAVLLAGAGLAGAAALLGPPASAAVGTTLYASPTGSGSACTTAAPCSLTGVRDRVRTLTGSMTADIAVVLRGGTYRLTAPLQLGPADSGTNGHVVAYQAAPGEKPVFSGSTRVSGFTLFDSAKGIYRAPVAAGTQSRQLFVDGLRAQRARGPLNPGGFTQSGTSFTTSDSSYQSFTNQSQVEIVDDRNWKQMRCPLASFTRTANGGSSLNVAAGCATNNITSVPDPKFPYNGSGTLNMNAVSWVENAYQLLTQPGQFYLDSAAGFLYYLPRAGENLGTADVELPVAQELLDLSGTPGHLAPVNDNAAGVAYTGSWAVNGGRAFGDFGNDVHYTTTNGDSATFSFTGSGVDVLSEVNSDEGTVDVYVDGAFSKTVSAAGSARLAQQTLVSVGGLPVGAHTVKLVKTGGQYLLVDGFVVVPAAISPVHDISFTGIGFQDTTWTQPSTTGYIDNQAGVLWDPVTRLPIRIPAAVQVHRGKNISVSGGEIAHTGGTGVDLADGTQNSSVSGAWIHDTGGGGISVGEADDAFLTDPARMTSGDTVSRNWIDHVGQDYSDAVGIWAGWTRTLTVANNDIGHTPYSGMSLGWGWGWASSCALQGSNPCRHGTIYASGNQILSNHIHDVMGVLVDGGPIYTLGGQGDGTTTSVLAGNLVEGGNNTNFMLYHDEGSSYWNTYNNVVRFGGGNWVGMWTPTIHDISIHDNYSDNSAYTNNGTNITFTQATIVSNGAWPAAAQAIIAAAGPDPATNPNPGPVDDTDPAVTYGGAWITYNPGGCYNGTCHDANTAGATATLTFTGTGVTWYGITGTDQGMADVSLDGTLIATVNLYAATRSTDTPVFTRGGIPAGSHTLKIVTKNTNLVTVDAFAVTP